MKSFNTSILPYVDDALAHGWLPFPCWQDKRPACRFEYGTVPNVSIWPETGVYGIHCGKSGLIVIDVDHKFGTRVGIASFEKLMDDNGIQYWPETYTVQTYSGGYHLYFSDNPADPHTISAGKLAKDVDVRAGIGYVVGAGSVIDDKPYTVEDSYPVRPLPLWLSDALTEASKHETSHHTPSHRPGRHAGSAGDVATMPARQLARMLDGAVSRVAGAGMGERNALLFWGACRFGEAMNASRVDEDEAVSELMSAAEANGLLSDDGEFSVLNTIYSGFRRVG